MNARSDQVEPNGGIELRSVAVPSEHGGWSLTLEPVLLGLLVGPSWPGVLLGLVALLGFLVRTPAKLVFIDSRRGRVTERAALAMRVVRVEVALASGLLVAIFLMADNSFVWPILAAVPLVLLEFWYDVRSRGRRLVPELAGTIAMGSVAASVALLGSVSLLVAMGLWLAIAARAVGAVLFVRVQLRRAKGQPFSMAMSDGAQVVAVTGMAIGAWLGLVTWVGAAAVAVIAFVHLWLARRPPARAQMVGAQQVVFGLFIVLTVGLGALAP